ncbi:substrate-binding domain-containing protein [Aliiroseovarius sp. KMU-50]|uniref:Substrate-binding domain-containing protein n=1 Tax=Aliiroseovarius salicola TaxID=3009082 RepID=A0ABT4W6G6_9RHOB|nr:substrate-binding domain-containing protein [Aliiroseovarius sp. KMU-50]MDA5095477.1 substrate-binding domain-containing protein [Aliiroseovarius sp. KMU-50]
MSAARNATHQRSGIVGVIVTRLQDPFFSETIALISRRLQAHGWQMLLFTVETEAEVDDALNSLMQFKIDGVMILSAILSDQMAQACKSQGIPVLLYNRDTDGLGVSSVQIENREGGKIAADFLCETSHERIAFIGGERDDATSKAREDGFADRLAEAGQSVFLREYGDYTFEGGVEAGLRLFSRHEKPDAVFCASDVMALGVLHAARHQLGLDAPKDFSLIGFDDIPSASWPGHALTTIRQPVRRMIQDAVELLIDRIEDTELDAVIRHFPGTLILRDTVRL